MEDPRIVRPSVPFVDLKTGNISREWFYWLLSLVTEVNVTKLTNIFNSTTSVTQELSQPSAQAQAVRLVAEVPTPIPQVGKRDVQDARFLAQLPTQPGITKRDIQDVRLVDRIPRSDAELSKRVDAIAIQLAQLNAVAANLAAKLNEVQTQLIMQAQIFPYWTLGSVNAVSPTAPDRTLTVAVGGTPYYIHAKTTND